jgi:hypothetical protein
MADRLIGTRFLTELKDPAESKEPSPIYHVILVLLFLMLLLRPTFGQTLVGVRLATFLWIAIFVGSLLSVRHRKALFWFGVLLMVPAIVFQLLGSLSTSLELLRAGLAITAFLFIAVAFLTRILSYSKVTGASVSGSLCVYFIFGIVWAIAYATIERLTPGSFKGLDQGGDLLEQLIYFSYVTLTTLGYGDITPVQPVAETLAMVEAVLGQLFLVGLVAFLVGKAVAGETD